MRPLLHSESFNSYYLSQNKNQSPDLYPKWSDSCCMPSNFISYYLPPDFLFSRHTGLTSIPQTGQSQSCLKAFALAISFYLEPSSPRKPMASSLTTFRFLLKKIIFLERPSVVILSIVCNNSQIHTPHIYTLPIPLLCFVFLLSIHHYIASYVMYFFIVFLIYLPTRKQAPWHRDFVNLWSYYCSSTARKSVWHLAGAQ